nr:GspE/PulE family protein [Polycladospora coralii]
MHILDKILQIITIKRRVFRIDDGILSYRRDGVNPKDFVNRLFQEAVRLRASDIHIEHQIKQLRIRMRIDGLLMETEDVKLELGAGIVSRLKVMSQLDIGEKRKPQDGAMTVRTGNHQLDIRISTLPTFHGEKVVLRILDRHATLFTFAELGFTTDQQSTIHRFMARKSGLLIVTGPTGSGKTSTLYSLLQTINHVEKNIVTLEDPIERQLDGINQVQIQLKGGFTFAEGLRAILRQDPDVMMVGEIRDLETATIAIRAALTGHLVLSTLHTVDGVSAIMRLLDIGIEPYRVAAALNGVIAQRLVRLKCEPCTGIGCPRCKLSGAYGRTGIFEVISAEDETFQRMIIEKKARTEWRSYLEKRGLVSLKQALLVLYQKEKISKGELIQVMNDVDTSEMEHGALRSF